MYNSNKKYMEVKNMWTQYKGYQITYEIEDGKVVVQTANYNGIQCSYKQIFDSMSDLYEYIDNGGWGVGSGTT